MIRRKRESIIAKLLVKATLLLLLLVGLSFFASHFWVFDLLSNFTVQYAAAALFLSLALFLKKKYAFSVISLAVAMFQAYQTLPLWQMPESVKGKTYEEVKVLQYNVRSSNDNIEEITRWIISNSEEIDIVILQEVTKKWGQALERIKWTYPYHISRETDNNYGIAILSKLLIDEMEVLNEKGTDVNSALIRGSTLEYDMNFVIKTIHPPAPLTPQLANIRNEILLSSADLIAEEEADYKMIAGDLNITRYSPWFSEAVERSGLYDSNEGLGLIGTWPTFSPKIFGLAIDNLLVSKNIIVKNKKYGPDMGSDHYPIITTFAFLVSEESKEE